MKKGIIEVDKAEKREEKKEETTEEKSDISYTYIVECTDGSLYTGITKDVSKRMQTHAGRTKQSAKYTKAHQVKEVRMVWETTSYSLAARLEYAIKRLKKEQKLRLIEEPREMFLPLFPKLEEVADQYEPAPQLCGTILENQIQKIKQ